MTWSWDISKLKGPAKWSYFHLYTIIDIYSRYVVGWTRESAELAERLLFDTIEKQNIRRDQLTIHSDNGFVDGVETRRVPARRLGRDQVPLPPAYE